MLLQATMAASVRVATSFSPTKQEFSAKNGFEEEKKEEEGGDRKIWKVLYVNQRDFFL